MTGHEDWFGAFLALLTFVVFMLSFCTTRWFVG